jgi:hypothetical protein
MDVAAEFQQIRFLFHQDRLALASSQRHDQPFHLAECNVITYK